MATFTVRISDEMHQRIKDAAEADDRSLNGEVSWLLKVALDVRESRASGTAEWPREKPDIPGGQNRVQPRGEQP